MKLKIKKLHPDAITPTYATPGSACFDIYAFDPKSGSAVLYHGKSLLIGTGLSLEIPVGQCLKMYSRSGHGLKYNVCLANGTGIIDSDYRDELKVIIINHGVEPFLVKHGDRIAQAMLVPVEQVEFEEVDSLSETERLGGFGSTGK